MTHHEQLLVDARATRDFLSDRTRWIQGSQFDVDPLATPPVFSRACLRGAANIATGARLVRGDDGCWQVVRGDYHRFTRLMVYLRIQLCAEEPGCPFSVEGWNDQAECTHARVLALLDACIARVELKIEYEKQGQQADAIVDVRTYYEFMANDSETVAMFPPSFPSTITWYAKPVLTTLKETVCELVPA